MHGEIRHLIGHKRSLAEKNIRAEIVRNGEIIEINKDLKIKKDATNSPERLFVDGKIIANSENIAFRERSRMSSQGLLILQIGYKTSEKKQKIQFSSFGLPRFEDYLDELKTNAERFLNNMAKKKNRYDLDELERFVKEDIYSISGKKPILKITEMD
jgi:mRNA degradation ribonuclease J1/J2